MPYISLNKQTFIPSNISHGSSKLEVNLEPSGQVNANATLLTQARK